MGEKMRLLILSLISTLAFFLSTFPSMAAPPAGVIYSHRIKFYLDPQLLTNMDEARIRLAKYVNDMNAVLSINTNRRIIFDPASDLFPATSQPFGNSSFFFPKYDFEIRVFALKSITTQSHGGYATTDESGLLGIGGMNWLAIYDPDKLADYHQVADYWFQVTGLLHELAHGFGAGVGEYYKFALASDQTGIAPIENVNIYNSQDPYWNTRFEMRFDPLLGTSTKGFSRFSELTANLINSAEFRDATTRQYANQIMADMRKMQFRVEDLAGRPIANAKIRVYRPNSPTLIKQYYTNSLGEVVIDWKFANYETMVSEFAEGLRIFKISKTGYIPDTMHLNVFDAQNDFIVKNQRTTFRRIIKLVHPTKDQGKILEIKREPNRFVSLTYAAPNTSCWPESSTDLTFWEILHQREERGVITYIDYDAPNFPMRFYRLTCFVPVPGI